jgi:hypothetical protein
MKAGCIQGKHSEAIFLLGLITVLSPFGSETDQERLIKTRQAGFFSFLPANLSNLILGKCFEIPIMFSVHVDKLLILHKATTKRQSEPHPCKFLVPI